MPKVLEMSLRRRARGKGLKGKQPDVFGYGTLWPAGRKARLRATKER